MCYEYDYNWYELSLAAERLRRSRENKEKTEQKKEGAPSKSTAPGKRVQDKEPVPA
ncbi:MAG: hypothetical protein HY661_05465 [Betaproteobacteria bacterium]|nr:hypothetical protein [Betaproteobacteria bacterium]